MINLILINFIITEVWDKLNFPNTIAGILTGWITNGRITNVILKPPLGCSFCMVFWISVIYLLVVNTSILPAIAISLLNGILTKPMLYIINLFEDIVDNIFNKLNNLVNK